MYKTERAFVLFCLILWVMDLNPNAKHFWFDKPSRGTTDAKRGRDAARVGENVGFRRKCKRCRLSRGAVLFWNCRSTRASKTIPSPLFFDSLRGVFYRDEDESPHLWVRATCEQSAKDFSLEETKFLKRKSVDTFNANRSRQFHPFEARPKGETQHASPKM